MSKRLHKYGMSQKHLSQQANDPYRVVCDADTVERQGALAKALTKSSGHTQEAKGKAGGYLALSAPYGSWPNLLSCSPHSFGSCWMLPGPFKLQRLHLHGGYVLF